MFWHSPWRHYHVFRSTHTISHYKLRCPVYAVFGGSFADSFKQIFLEHLLCAREVMVHQPKISFPVASWSLQATMCNRQEEISEGWWMYWGKMESERPVATWYEWSGKAGLRKGHLSRAQSDRKEWIMTESSACKVLRRKVFGRCS